MGSMSENINPELRRNAMMTANDKAMARLELKMDSLKRKMDKTDLDSEKERLANEYYQAARQWNRAEAADDAPRMGAFRL